MVIAIRPLPEQVVLVVDDDAAVCILTARILAEAGFHVLEAHSAPSAIAMLASLSGSVQLVVSDLVMPEMTGDQLAATMAERWPTTPILLMSGHGGPPKGYSGPFLPKPFPPELLLDAVAGLVSVPKP